MNWLAEFVTRRAAVIVTAWLLVTGVAAYQAVDLRFSYSLRSLYDYPGNPDVGPLDRYLAQFGDDYYFVLLLVRTDDVFSPEALSFIQKLSHGLDRQQQFRRVWSVAVNDVPRGEGDAVMTGPLFETVPRDPEQLRKLRRFALASDLVVPRWVSADGRYAVIAAEMRTRKVGDLDEMQAAVDAADRVIRGVDAPAGTKVWVSGSPAIETGIRNVLLRDQMVFAPFAGLIIIVVLFVVFRSVHGVILPLLNVLVSVVWVLGLMATTGAQINIVSNTIPTILLIYGILDSIFVISHFYRLNEGGNDRREAARRTILRVGWPCAVTSLTTAVGFAAFSLSSVPMMRSFGLFLALGVVFAFVGGVILLPAALCLFPAPRQGYSGRTLTLLAGRVLDRLATVVARRPGSLIAVALALLIGCAVIAGTKNRVDVLFIDELPPSLPSVEAHRLLSEHLFGALHVSLVVRGSADAVKKASVLESIDRVHRWALKQPQVRSVLSLAGLVRALNKAFHGGEESFDRIPSSERLIAQYLALLDPDTHADFVTTDYSQTHLRLTLPDDGSASLLEFVDQLRAVAKKELGRHPVKLEVTGVSAAGYRGNERMVVETVWSFGLAFVVITLLVAVAFRSFRLALVVALPNLLPTIACLAILGLSGISMRTGTVLFLCVAVGVVFDNTIHILDHLRETSAAEESLPVALKQTLRVIGPPVLYSSLLITAGFGIFLVSDFEILASFGLTCVAVVSLGLLADLVVTPAVLLRGGKALLSRRWKKRR